MVPQSQRTGFNWSEYAWMWTGRIFHFLTSMLENNKNNWVSGFSWGLGSRMSNIDEKKRKIFELSFFVEELDVLYMEGLLRFVLENWEWI
jgi:hypothetical protein